MSNLSRISELLGSDAGPDYWSDELLGYAHSLVEDLSPEDWGKVRDLWKGKDPEWQKRYVDVISCCDDAKASPILIDMLESASDEVSLHAGDSLRFNTFSAEDVRRLEDARERLAFLSRRSEDAAFVIREITAAMESQRS